MEKKFELSHFEKLDVRFAVKMGSSENDKLGQNAHQIADSTLPDLSNFCILTMNDYLDGLSMDIRVNTGKLEFTFSSNLFDCH